MKNTENSRKTRILGSFLYAVFTYTVLHGEDRLNMIEDVKLDWFLVITYKVFPSCSKDHQKFENPILTDFSVINYVIMTSRDDFS